jgi:hypothetical protein
MIQKLGLFLSLGERRETPTLLGPLEISKLNHWSSLRLIISLQQVSRENFDERGDVFLRNVGSHTHFRTVYCRI